MDARDPAQLLRAALVHTGGTLTRLPGRPVSSGLHEVRDLGPSLRASLIVAGVPAGLVTLNHRTAIAHWKRTGSHVDLLVLGSGDNPELVAELKVWDIGHQLFDLAKMCCLLAAGARAGFLVSVAKLANDFDRLPGGELFPAVEGEVHEHDFLALIRRHRHEWLDHVGKGGPEPTALPARVTTAGIAAGIAIDAYPGHAVRAVQVGVADATPIELLDGWPEALPRP